MNKPKWHRISPGHYSAVIDGFDCQVEQLVEGDWSVRIFRDGLSQLKVNPLTGRHEPLWLPRKRDAVEYCERWIEKHREEAAS